jgi:hypothetical protein
MEEVNNKSLLSYISSFSLEELSFILQVHVVDSHSKQSLKLVALFIVLGWLKSHLGPIQSLRLLESIGWGDRLMVKI